MSWRYAIACTLLTSIFFGMPAYTKTLLNPTKRLLSIQSHNNEAEISKRGDTSVQVSTDLPRL